LWGNLVGAQIGNFGRFCYHPEEISEIYLGARASDEWKAEAEGLAKAVNPHIAVYEMFYVDRAIF
jgi:hypothetical protein